MDQFVSSHVMIWCFLALWSYVTCNDAFIVWSDDLDEPESGGWIKKGSINPTHSNYCPASSDCMQIESQSSIKTSIPSKDYFNFTLLFGITISDENNTFDNDDYCRVYYKTNNINTNNTNASTQNWKLLTSYFYDQTSDFNNKLPSQSSKLPSSQNNEYYESIYILFINTANASNTHKPYCYIDEISLIAQFYHSPSKPFQFNSLFCMAIAVFVIILLAVLICLVYIWLSFNAKKDKHTAAIGQLQDIRVKADSVPDTSLAKTSISTVRDTITTSISDEVHVAGFYHQPNQKFATRTLSDEAVIASYDSKNKKSLSEHCENIVMETTTNNCECIRENTQIKLNTILNRVLHKNNKSNTISVPSSRRETEFSFNANINLTSYDLYEEEKNKNMQTKVISVLKNRYQNPSKSMNDSQYNESMADPDQNDLDTTCTKIKFSKYKENEECEEESLDIGSIRPQNTATFTQSSISIIDQSQSL